MAAKGEETQGTVSWVEPAHSLSTLYEQSSKKTINVRDPNLVVKMSDFHFSVNNSQIWFLVLKLLFIQL